MEPHQQLEAELQDWSGKPYVVSCASGTAALQLALTALDFPRGSEVIVPEFTMISCARAVTMAGLKPVFIDCREDLLIDPDKIMRAVNADTKAIMPVHIYGRYCDMERIVEIAKACGLAVVEDCAEYHRPSMRGLDVPHAICWSFYRNKVIAGEEGGAVAFQDYKLAERARILRNCGSITGSNFIHIQGGFNARMSNAHASLILNSLRQYAANRIARRDRQSNYNHRIPLDFQMSNRDVVWVYDVQIPGMSENEQNRLVESLNNQGIAARHAFKSMSEQPEYLTAHYRYASLVAYRISREVVYLPVHPDMTKDEVEKICDAFLAAVPTRLIACLGIAARSPEPARPTGSVV